MSQCIVGRIDFTWLSNIGVPPCPDQLSTLVIPCDGDGDYDEDDDNEHDDDDYPMMLMMILIVVMLMRMRLFNLICIYSPPPSPLMTIFIIMIIMLVMMLTMMLLVRMLTTMLMTTMLMTTMLMTIAMLMTMAMRLFDQLLAYYFPLHLSSATCNLQASLHFPLSNIWQCIEQ